MLPLQLHIIIHNDMSKRQLQHFRSEEPSGARMSSVSKWKKVSLCSSHIELSCFIMFIFFIHETERFEFGGVGIISIVKVNWMGGDIDVCSLRYVGAILESERLTCYAMHHNFARILELIQQDQQ